MKIISDIFSGSPGLVAVAGVALIGIFHAFAEPSGNTARSPMESDPLFIEFLEWREDFAWGLGEVMKMTDDPDERQRLLEEYIALNGEVKKWWETVNAQLGEKYPLVEPEQVEVKLVPEDDEIFALRRELGMSRAILESESVVDLDERQRLLEQFHEEHRETRRQIEILLERSQEARNAAILLRNPTPDPPPKPVLGTPEEIELLTLRSELGNGLRTALNTNDEAMGPDERQRRLEAFETLNSETFTREAELSRTVAGQIKEFHEAADEDSLEPAERK